MSIHVIQIGKQKFACGLFWQLLSRPNDLKHEVLGLAAKIDCDLSAVRREQGVLQVGYANTKDQARVGMISLGATVAHALATDGLPGTSGKSGEKIASSWLGAFSLPDGKWVYFAVRDGNFLPNGDFAGTRAEVLERLYADYGLGGWGNVLGDPELDASGFQNFCGVTLDRILAPVKGRIRVQSGWKLRSVHRQTNWRLIGAAAAVLAVGTAGAWYYHHLQELKERERLAAEAAAHRKQVKPKNAVIVHPWAGKPLPQDVATACLEKFDLSSPGGWQLGEYSCTQGAATYAWTRGESRIDYLLEKVPQAAIDVGGNKATFVQPLQVAQGTNEELMPARDLLAPMQSRFQELGLTAKLALVTATAPASSGRGKKADAVPQETWKTYKLSVAADGLPPADVVAILAQPGVRLEKLSYRAGNWSIEGVIYAK